MIYKVQDMLKSEYRNKPIKRSLREFRVHWKSYLFQSLMATLAVFFLLLILSKAQLLIVASLGATAFIIFAMPKSKTAYPRHVIGGHLIGLLCGAFASFVPHSQPVSSLFLYSITVGLSIFLMVSTDTEHPPAAGTALGITFTGFTFNVALTVVMGSIFLSLIHKVFRKYLKDISQF